MAAQHAPEFSMNSASMAVPAECRKEFAETRGSSQLRAEALCRLLSYPALMRMYGEYLVTLHRVLHMFHAQQGFKVR